MNSLKELLLTLKEVQKVGILSGAGLSAESGIPTFRGKDGLWNKFNPVELATLEAFKRVPETVWKWYLWRMHLIAKAKPNPAHFAISKMEKLFPEFLHITQNVDGLHRESGNKNFVELHGYIFQGKCRDCGKVYPEEEFSKVFPYAGKDFLRNLSKETFKKEILEKLKLEDLPECPNCGSIIGPGVVWFGESLPEEAIEKAVNFSKRCDVMFVVGTSALVQPAASIPLMAKESGTVLVEINPESTPISAYCDFTFRDSVSSVLPKLVKELEQR